MLNILIRVRENFIRFNKTYNVFDRDTEHKLTVIIVI